MPPKQKVNLAPAGTQSPEAEVVLELSTQGANIAINYSSPSKKRKFDSLQLAQWVTTSCVSIKVAFHPTDPAIAAAVEKYFDDVMKEFVRLDIVVNTVGHD